jgi:hypothetical protein
MKGMRAMRKSVVVMIGIVVAALAGCGQNFEWFPSSSGGGGGASPIPAPSSAVLTDQQADTDVRFTTYTVLGLPFANTSTSVSVAGDTTTKYIKNSNAATNSAGKVRNNDTVTVQQTTANYKNTQVTSYLYIGGTSASYASTTSTFCFPSKKGQLANTEISSDAAIVPASLPAAFTFPATIAIDSANTTAINPKIFFGGTQISSGANIPAGTSLILKHTTGTSGQTAITTATLTPTSGTVYKVTFKTVSQ